MENNRKQLLIKVFVSILTFVVIILAEIKFSGPLKGNFKVFEFAYQGARSWRWCVRALVWGGGNTPNLVVIMVYSALLE